MKKLLCWFLVPFLVALLVFTYWMLPVQGESVVKPKKETVSASMLPNVNIYDFAIRSIPSNQDFYHLDKPVNLKPEKTAFDAEGIPMYQEEEGKPIYNHPVRLAHNAIHFLKSYEMTHDPRYLNEAKRYVERLMKIAVVQDGALYFPYDFDLYLHNLPTEHLKPRWYSGMAQGQTLSALVRLYQVTGDEKYRKGADQVFQSLLQTKKDHPIWVTMVDDHDYWIEEYPMEKPTHVLNGFIFSIYGLYDYVQLTNNEQAKILLKASLTTVYDHIEQYRKKNDASRYGLKLDQQSLHYHLVHIEQLKDLYHMTGDRYFLDMSETFYQDWYGWPAKIKRQLEKIKGFIS